MNHPIRFQLDPQLQNQIWNGDLQLPQKQIDLRLRLKKWLNNREKCPYSRFLSGKEITEMPARDDMTRLTADLMARFQPMVQAVNVMHLLGKLVDFNNAQSSIKLCPPPIPMIAKGEANPFAKADLAHLEDVSNFRTLLANALRDTTKTSERKPGEGESPNNDPPHHKILVGRLLLSAIVHGGLIHSSILESLIRMLSSDAPVLHSAGGRVYVEFSLSYKNQENSEFRRWFPDALTSVLLIRIQRDSVRQVIPFDVLQKDKKSNLREHLWRCIKACLRDAGVSSGQLPGSLAQLLALTKLDLETRIPIFLVNYAARKFVSHSLKPDVWRRLHGLTPKNVAETRSTQTSDTVDRLELPDVGEQEEIESRWLQLLRRNLKGNDRAVVINQVKDLLAANHEVFAPGYPGELFAGFSLYILHAKNGQSYRFALSSMRDYVIGVSRRLGGLLGMESVREFDSMSWSSLYEEVLSDAESIGLRRKVIRILREFQRYLEADRGVPALEEDVLGTTVGLVPVDANILSEYEFLKARRKILLNSDMEKDLATIHWLVLTLAYRCGLRRSEVLMLELADVHTHNPAELIIRPNASRRLKSPSATRKLPIQALLPSGDLNMLRSWKTSREKQEKSDPYSRFLFALPLKNQKSLEADKFIEEMHTTLREGTGDPSIRFHHLRHSFASRLVLLLAKNSSGNASLGSLLPKDFFRLYVQEPSSPPDSFKSLTPESMFSYNFRGTLYNHDRISRRDPWAVASLLGHSGPDISMEHYVHVLDLCLAAELMHPSIAPTKSTIVNASGKPWSTAIRNRTESNGFHSWVSKLLKSSQPKLPTCKSSNPHLTRETLDVRPVESKLDLTWNALLRHDTEAIPVEKLVTKLDVTPQDFNNYLVKARDLSQMKISATGKEFRHRFMSWTPDKRQPGMTQRISCPIRPREKRDLEFLRVLEPMMCQVLKDHRDLTMQILEHYANHARADFSGILFTDPAHPEMAKLYLQWFRLLGLAKSQLLIESFDMTNRSALTAQWRTGLELHPSELKKSYPPMGRKTWACPWLGITPILKHGNTVEGSPAFRFIMVMTYITTF